MIRLITLTPEQQLDCLAALAELHDAFCDAGVDVLRRLARGVRAGVAAVASAAATAWQWLRRLSPAVRREEARQRALAARLAEAWHAVPEPEIVRALQTLGEHLLAGCSAIAPAAQRAADAMRALATAEADASLELRLQYCRPDGPPLSAAERERAARLLALAYSTRAVWLGQRIRAALDQSLPYWRLVLASADASRAERGLPLFPLARVHALQEFGNGPQHFMCPSNPRSIPEASAGE